MLCPFCKQDFDKVLDSRPLESSSVIRRRRQCLNCKHRFTTYERLEEMPLLVSKSDNRREPFDRSKLREGILRACEKRPVSIDAIEKIVSEVEYEISQGFVLEVLSKVIGEKVLKKLDSLDPVAYVRFASVYRNFSSLTDFTNELKSLHKRRPGDRRSGKTIQEKKLASSIESKK